MTRAFGRTFLREKILHRETYLVESRSSCLGMGNEVGTESFLLHQPEQLFS